VINEEIARKTLQLEVQAGKSLAREILKLLKKVVDESKNHGNLEKYVQAQGSEMQLKDMVKKGQLVCCIVDI